MDDFSKQKGLHEFWGSSQLAGHNAAYLEDLYETYLLDPASVPAHWRTFFETLPGIEGQGAEPVHSAIREAFRVITGKPRGGNCQQ